MPIDPETLVAVSSSRPRPRENSLLELQLSCPHALPLGGIIVRLLNGLEAMTASSSPVELGAGTPQELDGLCRWLGKILLVAT